MILTLLKKQSDSQYFIIIPEAGDTREFSFLQWKKSENLKIDYEISPNFSGLVSKIEKNSVKLGTLGEAIQGLTPYDSYRGHSKELIKNRGFHFKEKIDDSCGIWLDGKNLNRYHLTESDEWLRYGNWLAAPREKKFFEGARILFREIPGQNKRIQSTYTDEVYYHGHSITPFILFNRQNKIELLRILGILNSKLISWYASQKSPNFSKKTFPKLNPKDIKEFPINKSYVNFPIDKAVQNIIDFNKKHSESNIKFIKFFSSRCKIEKLNKKLEGWYELTFSEFINELNKSIKAAGYSALSKKEEFNWMEIFEENKAKAQDLKDQIDKTDKEIDQMVYELYGLSDEEIGIIENS